MAEPNPGKDENPHRGGPLRWLKIIAVGRKPERTLLRILILVLFTYVTFTYVLIPVRITGVSMEPTYHDRSINFINRLSFCIGQPRRGDMVAIRYTGRHAMLLKRIVGVPGDTVSYSGGHVCIDGVRQAEPYVKLISDWEMEGRKLGPDEYYVVGDNRGMPREDHAEGVVLHWRIVGKPILPGNK